MRLPILTLIHWFITISRTRPGFSYILTTLKWYERQLLIIFEFRTHHRTIVSRSPRLQVPRARATHLLAQLEHASKMRCFGLFSLNLLTACYLSGSQRDCLFILEYPGSIPNYQYNQDSHQTVISCGVSKKTKLSIRINAHNIRSVSFWPTSWRRPQ